MAKVSLQKFNPVPLTQVQLGDCFWAPRVETNRTSTLPIEYAQCKKTRRIDAYKLNWKPGKGEPPHIFWGSDVAKWLEAVGYALATHPDSRLERLADRVIEPIEKAQQKDGYLNVYFTVVEPQKRWTNLRDRHELYCAGHMMEAAVAYYEATGKRKLLDVMCRYADHIDRQFGPARGQRRGYPGHEEIELALVKLYRATGERRYLKLSKFFVDERGRQPHYYTKEARARGDDPKTYWAKDYSYNQSHLPVREQTEAVGHAVRAMYLYSGMADVAAETGDKTLLDACRRLWKNLVGRRMYITGGIGPAHANEGFTFDYDLPDESAYAETCAAIGLVFWAHRMLHLDPDGRYADVMELALYNGALSGVSLDGTKFFYANPLATYPKVEPNKPMRAGQKRHYQRSEWFGCACCPPNIARLIASFGQYVYSQGPSEARVNLYVGSKAELQVGGQTVRIEQRTRYPWDPKVRIRVRPEKPAAFTLSLRIPGWCRGAKLKVNGKPVAAAGITKKGYAKIRRQWAAGDVVELVLPMPVERIEANPKVRQAAGRVALQRGPIVYCLEEIDNGPGLHDLALPREAKLRAAFDPKLLGGVTVITGKAKRREQKSWSGDLYRPAGTKTESAAIKAVPYACWNNRRPGEMRVWMNEA